MDQHATQPSVSTVRPPALHIDDLRAEYVLHFDLVSGKFMRPTQKQLSVILRSCETTGERVATQNFLERALKAAEDSLQPVLVKGRKLKRAMFIVNVVCSVLVFAAGLGLVLVPVVIALAIAYKLHKKKLVEAKRIFEEITQDSQILRSAGLKLIYHEIDQSQLTDKQYSVSIQVRKPMTSATSSPQKLQVSQKDAVKRVTLSEKQLAGANEPHVTPNSARGLSSPIPQEELQIIAPGQIELQSLMQARIEEAQVMTSSPKSQRVPVGPAEDFESSHERTWDEEYDDEDELDYENAGEGDLHMDTVRAAAAILFAEENENDIPNSQVQEGAETAKSSGDMENDQNMGSVLATEEQHEMNEIPREEVATAGECKTDQSAPNETVPEVIQ